MELRVLKYFLTVANEHSISKAAEVLHVTQPTLSRQIMDLEDELDSKLLIRSKQQRCIELTEEGTRLYDYATQIIDLETKAKNEFAEKNDFIEGDVYIGAGESQAIRLVAKTALFLQEEHPKLCYHFFSGCAETVSARLDKGLIDFGIFIGMVNMEKYEYAKLNATDTWGLLMRKDNPLSKKKTIAPHDLDNIPIFTSKQAMNLNLFSPWYGRGFDKLNIIGTYNLLYNASIMVDEGFGTALCLDKIANTSNESNLCFRPLKPKLEQELYIAWRKGAHFSKAAELFLKTLKGLV